MSCGSGGRPQQPPPAPWLPTPALQPRATCSDCPCCLFYCFCALCCPGEGLAGALAETKSGALCLGFSTSYSEQQGLARGAHASRSALLVCTFLPLVQLFWGKEIVCCKHNVQKGQCQGHHFKNTLLSTPVRDSKH